MSDGKASCAKVALTLEAIANSHEDASKEETPTTSLEQFLMAQIQLPDEDIADDASKTPESTHLILVVDNSGSMAGSAMSQVKDSLRKIIGHSIMQDHFKTDLIIYNSRAKILDLHRDTYESVIDGIKAESTTDFKAAFEKLNKVVTLAGKQHSSTVVVFMTDGCDTTNCQKTVMPRLVGALHSQWVKQEKEPVTIHTVGFTSAHDFKFLKQLAEEGGTTAGMFRYCEPADGQRTLEGKLDELFDFLLLSKPSTMTVSMAIPAAKGHFLCQEITRETVQLVGRVQPIEEEVASGRGPVVLCDIWIHLAESLTADDVTVTVERQSKKDGETHIEMIPCVVESVSVQLMESTEERVMWQLRVMSRNVDDVVAKTAAAIAEKSDVEKLQERVERLQQQVSQTQVFGKGISMEARTRILGSIKEAQANLDQVQSMLAEYMRAGTDSISLLARAHDMRYQAVFSKSRRQRVMDKRATKNMMGAAKAQQDLASLIVDSQEVRQLSQESLGFFFCVLSQNSVQDILIGEEREDVLGFGLAVKRTEVVLDEPTLIRLQVISGTLVSRSAMLDALEYKLNVSSHLKAHGGFSFQDAPLGVTTVGTGREPINAWLPLYITRSHWERVKVLLKPALGQFCTLDPLGYHYKQLDVLFTVLGAMISQLSGGGGAGEHQLRLLYCLQRTCTACMEDFNLKGDICKVVQEFVSSPAGRTKDVIPNLNTLIGYIVAMPTEKAQEIFKIGSDGSCLARFWLGYIAECLRRGAGSLYAQSNKPVINGVLNALLHGTNMETAKEIDPSSVCVELVRQCHDPYINDLELNIVNFDPASEVEVPDVKLKHEDKVDRAMEIWAEAVTGHQKNLSKSKKYKDALRVVREWAKDGPKGAANVKTEVEAADEEVVEESMESGTEEKKSKESQFDTEQVSMSTLMVTAKTHNRLCKSAFPYVQSLPSYMAFVNNWLSRQHNITDLDLNSGLAPDEWVTEVKEAVKDTYNKIKGKKPTSVVNLETENTSVDVGSGPNTEVLPCQVDVENAQTDNITAVNYDNKDNQEPDDDYDDDDMDGLFDTDDYGSDEDATQAAMATIRKKKTRDDVCVPEVLQCIDISLDTFNMTRAMLCQAVCYYSNSSARAAISSKCFVDLAGGDTAARESLCQTHDALEEFRVATKQRVLDEAEWKRANHCMIYASTTWAFVGYLLHTHKDRNEGFNELVYQMGSTMEAGHVPPYLNNKVHVLLTGKYKDCPVLDNGNQWLPEKSMAKKIRNLLDEKTWEEFMMELRSSVAIHVYRESDIPNRHGHCNSNPYIPNSLRAKLGMELMPEQNPPGSRKKRKR